MDKSRYRALFVEEARRVIGNGEVLVSDAGALASNVNALHRCFHTLKGMSATMNYGATTLLAHALEDVCDGITQERLSADEAIAALFVEALDALRKQVDQIEAGAEPEPDAHMERRIREHLQSGATTGFRLLVPALEDEPTTDEASLPRTEDAVGAIAEILATCNRLRELANGAPPIVREVGRLEDAARGLYQRLVELRQVPFGTVIPALRRHLRHVCREHGRDAVLDSQGEDLLVDPDVLVPLQAALVQLLNNAVIHGIEPPADRVVANKPAAGRIGLRAERAGGKLLIRLSDDGRGLDGARLRKVAGIPDGDPVALATMPGVSTAIRVDHHAGRGQGLPAVLHTIDRMGGTVEISSLPARGVRVHLEVPVQTDLEELVLVQVGQDTYGLLARQARPIPPEVDDVPPLLGLPVNGHATLQVRGRDHVRVDRVLGSVSAIVRPPPFPFTHLNPVVGTTVAPDGRILFVVDASCPTRPEGAGGSAA
ncbi:MAG: Hpt domain-containing protein [Myxococcota bacterium]